MRYVKAIAVSLCFIAFVCSFSIAHWSRWFIAGGFLLATLLGAHYVDTSERKLPAQK